ncbi:MAG: 2-dehydropantoate 2-reductase [Rhizobiales bacterium]|nr:2-dehydropantoate 2-reductase [Hyphomicrobiales bacterium]
MTARFVIVGAGAIGCHIGGRLATAGNAVVFVARPRIAAALESQGLAVSDLDGFRAVLPPTSLVVGNVAEAAAGAAPSLVLLCTKGGATAEAAAAIGRAFPSGTPVLSLQNGIDNVARIRTAAPGLAALAGMVPFNVVLGPDDNGLLTAHRATSGELHAEDHPACRAVADVFARAGLPLRLVADMASVQWGKLLFNLNNPVNALAGLPLREELLDARYRQALAALQAEALAVMAKAGIRPARIGPAPPRLVPAILRLPTWAFRRIAAGMLKIDPAARSSMWDDLQAGRPTEIDDLCGAIVRLAAAEGLPAPKNAAMIELVKQAGGSPRYSGAELLHQLGIR